MAFKKLASVTIIILFMANVFAQSIGSEFVIIANKPDEVSLNKRQLTNIFRGQKAFWDNENPITIVLPSDKHEHAEEIAKLVYNQSHLSVRKYWFSLVFQGRSNAPKFFDTDTEIIDYVRQTPGAIAIVKNPKAITDITVIPFTE
jgi:ABC-type phosphate transport system substrate-binding protein